MLKHESQRAPRFFFVSIVYSQAENIMTTCDIDIIWSIPELLLTNAYVWSNFDQITILFFSFLYKQTGNCPSEYTFLIRIVGE